MLLSNFNTYDCSEGLKKELETHVSIRREISLHMTNNTKDQKLVELVFTECILS